MKLKKALIRGTFICTAKLMCVFVFAYIFKTQFVLGSIRREALILKS